MCDSKVKIPDFELAPDIHIFILYAPRTKVHFIILTDYHPCNGRTCPFYGQCQAPTKTTHECVCVNCTTDESAPLCDNNDVTHKNKCEYNYHVCLAQEEPGIKHYGGCKRESWPSDTILLLISRKKIASLSCK